MFFHVKWLGDVLLLYLVDCHILRTPCDTKISIFCFTSTYLTESNSSAIEAQLLLPSIEEAKPPRILSFKERVGNQMHGGLLRVHPSGRRSLTSRKGNNALSSFSADNEAPIPRSLHNAIVEADAIKKMIFNRILCFQKEISGRV